MNEIRIDAVILLLLTVLLAQVDDRGNKDGLESNGFSEGL